MFKKIGIILFLILYLLSGFNKALNFIPTVELTQTKFPIKLPLWFFKLTIVGVIILLTIGSLLLIVNTFTNKFNKLAFYTTICMILFTIMATLMFHYPPVGADKYHFQKNLSIIGGFFIILGDFYRIMFY